MAQLTERQQEIKGRLEQGKPAAQIASELGITTNAVYQQIRRMRQGGAKVSSNGGGRSNARRSSGRNRPAPAPAQPQRPMTPLQAIRARRDEITSGVKEADAAVGAAERELARAKGEQEKVRARVADELKNLDAAESAIKGEKPKAQRPARKAGKKGSQRRSAPASQANGSQAASGQPGPSSTPTPPEGAQTEGQGQQAEEPAGATA